MSDAEEHVLVGAKKIISFSERIMCELVDEFGDDGAGAGNALIVLSFTMMVIKDATKASDEDMVDISKNALELFLRTRIITGMRRDV